MKPYHEAWLGAHPHRTEEWLKARLKDGFDVHHIDGDHNNNEPGNLILVEASDHMRLHGMSNGHVGILKRMSVASGPRPETLRLGEVVYAELKSILAQDVCPADVWGHVAKRLKAPRHKAITAARVWAKHNGRSWPVVRKNKKPVRKFKQAAHKYNHDYVPPRRVVGHR